MEKKRKDGGILNVITLRKIPLSVPQLFNFLFANKCYSDLRHKLQQIADFALHSSHDESVYFLLLLFIFNVLAIPQPLFYNFLREQKNVADKLSELSRKQFSLNLPPQPSMYQPRYQQPGKYEQQPNYSFLSISDILWSGMLTLNKEKSGILHIWAFATEMLFGCFLRTRARVGKRMSCSAHTLIHI